MRQSDTLGALAAALAKAQGAMSGASKDAKNPHFNSRYADLAAIVEACREPLAVNGLAVVQIPSTPEAGLVCMVTLVIHSSGEFLESEPLTVQAKDAGPQAVGSCLTYLRRYQLAALVGIAPEDDDAEAAEGRVVGRPQVPRPAQAPRPNAGRLSPPNSLPTPRAGGVTQPEPPPLNDSDIPF